MSRPCCVSAFGTSAETPACVAKMQRTSATPSDVEPKRLRIMRRLLSEPLFARSLRDPHDATAQLVFAGAEHCVATRALTRGGDEEIFSALGLHATGHDR